MLSRRLCKYVLAVALPLVAGCKKLPPAPVAQTPGSKPYTALYRYMPEQKSERVCSDGEKRVRDEFVGEDIFTIWDYNTRTMREASSDRQCFYDHRMDGSVFEAAYFQVSPPPFFLDEGMMSHHETTNYIGNEVVDGKLCRHYRNDPSEKVHADLWYSADLNCTVKYIADMFGKKTIVELVAYDNKKPAQNLVQYQCLSRDLLFGI